MNFIPINDFYSGSTGTQNNIHYPIKNIFLPGHIHKFQLLFGQMLPMEHSVSNISLKYHRTCLLRMTTKCGKKMPFLHFFCHVGVVTDVHEEAHGLPLQEVLTMSQYWA